jgi:hypothetical protein
MPDDPKWNGNVVYVQLLCSSPCKHSSGFLSSRPREETPIGRRSPSAAFGGKITAVVQISRLLRRLSPGSFLDMNGYVSDRCQGMPGMKV